MKEIHLFLIDMFGNAETFYAFAFMRFWISTYTFICEVMYLKKKQFEPTFKCNLKTFARQKCVISVVIEQDVVDFIERR